MSDPGSLSGRYGSFLRRNDGGLRTSKLCWEVPLDRGPRAILRALSIHD